MRAWDSVGRGSVIVAFSRSSETSTESLSTFEKSTLASTEP